MSDRPITKVIHQLRVLSNQTRKMEHEKFVNWVDENPMVDGSSSEFLTFIVPTRGCKYAMGWHGGCSMCTLPNDNPLAPSEEFVASFPRRILDIFNAKGGSKRFHGVKFYTSGSFLDPWELPIEVRNEIFTIFSPLVDEIVIETRCEYVLRSYLDDIRKHIPPEKLVVAIGQETTNDEINRRSINKGHTFRQFTRAVTLLHEYGMKVKGYVLLKPLFVSEPQAVYDAVESAKMMQELNIDSISINPSYIGKGTLMDQMFKQRTYQPPWLWSVRDVTRQIKQLVGNIRVICDPVAAGSKRGPQNCGKCDRELKERMKQFSATQDITLLEHQCACRVIYEKVMRNSHLVSPNGISNPFATY